VSIFGESKIFASRNQTVLVLLICVAAAVRVFIFSAAFPFFSNIDEDLHFDLITQYSHGQLPRGLEPLKDETLNWIVPYASPEFLSPPEQFPGGKFPPPLWKQTGREVGEEIAATRAAWSTEMNFESSQPPLYYIAASFWWWIGKHIGLVGLQSLYWIRFLNVSTASNRHCRIELHRICWIHGVAFNPIRLWRLHQSLTSASIFHVGPIVERCANSIRVSLCVWHEQSASPDRSCCESDRPWSHAHICYNFGDRHQSGGVCQRAQLVSSIATFRHSFGET
jgi:hypothetical protein